MILLTDIADKSDVSRVAGRIEQSLGEPFECDGHRFVVTPSIGIAIYPQDGNDIEDLLVKADMAMYQAKDQGRNGHAFYGESMLVRSLGRLELEIDLRRAFDAHEFQLYFQPKMNLATGAIVGVEALLRWNHPERGWIPPDKFIPVAEETGMIVAIGDWVIRETSKQLKSWANTDLSHLTIAVNVSVQQFAREDSWTACCALWRRHQAASDRIGDHREPVDEQCRRHDSCPESAGRRRPHLVHRRLRHGLLLARLPAPIAGRLRSRSTVPSSDLPAARRGGFAPRSSPWLASSS